MSSANLLTPGSIIGNYQILGTIAQGGMGIVYRAQHRFIKREVALKVMFSHLAEDSEFTQRFMREGQAMGQLRHPNIVEVYDASFADGYYYLAIEYLTGGTLNQQLSNLSAARQLMPVDQALNIIRQIASALDYAHAKGFVHRDIKPSNIIIASDGRYVLTDFGIVHAEGATKLTRSVEAMGTPEYMSPEQAQGQKVDGRSDLYSLGIVLYEMLAGKPPFVADTPWGTVYKHIKEPPTPINRIRTDLTPAVVEITNRVIAKKPEERYQTAGELVAAIDAVLKQKSAPAKTPGANRWLITGGIAALVVVILAALGLVVVTLLGSSAAPATVPPTQAPTVTRRTAATAVVANAATIAATVTPAFDESATAAAAAAATAAVGEPTAAADTPTPAVNAATPTSSANASPTAAKTNPSATPASAGSPTPPPATTPAKPGQLFNFEQPLAWKLGDEPYGSLNQSTEQVHDGTYSAKLTYNIPAVDSAFVVFLNSVSLSGQPTGLVAWVYGDGSGHFLNTWIADGSGQVRQYSFGRIYHTGWQQMVAWFDDTRPWPNSYISGPNNGKLSYPYTFKAFVLDAAPHGVATKGAIYIDEVYLTTQAIPASGATVVPSTPVPSTGATAQPTPASTTGGTPTPVAGLDFNFSNYIVGRENWGKPTSPDGCSNFDNNAGIYLKYEVNFDINNTGQSDISSWTPVFISNIQNVLPYCVNRAGSQLITAGSSTHAAYTLYMQGQYLQSVEIRTAGLTKRLCVDAYGKTISPC
ncbi:MAG: protein kinase [Chloroflexi bacterium]|nr:protein kinase [Chloroflexota bacterium]MCL5275589.1 protein kinase [Chloroflexota bacterium]